ncbi:hypothetical protein BBD42_30095 [Paenibacillus sp. BIHB 4019]|uniref:Copper amine oxidase-like N-terminal domain-containing protein n=1 Tax=Paenibacillus sp. BIHB 4019 TaxID=1870819 RepID=A0A1B2DRD4_9BACL|nr:hypothetical protein [Paenibacillus sp. BIHB 4019]ANY70274.1 hypothetical protein BBD42_30095 [Paenibacillus sp. BIHB 4019]
MQLFFERLAVRRKILFCTLAFMLLFSFPTGAMAVEAGTTNAPITLPSGFVPLSSIGDQKLSLQPAQVTDVAVAPYIFSPDFNHEMDYTDISYTINEPLSYFSLDAYAVVGNGLTWKGKILEEVNGMSPGSYKLSDWYGMVTASSSYFQLDQGYYVIVPRVGLGPDDYLIDQLAECIIDMSEPVHELYSPEIIVSGQIGMIRGRVISDLLVDILGDYSGISVSAYSWLDHQIYEATFTANGEFTIEVPILYGANGFEINIVDAARNGGGMPKYFVSYDTTEPED